MHQKSTSWALIMVLFYALKLMFINMMQIRHHKGAGTKIHKCLVCILIQTKLWTYFETHRLKQKWALHWMNSRVTAKTLINTQYDKDSFLSSSKLFLNLFISISLCLYISIYLSIYLSIYFFLTSFHSVYYIGTLLRFVTVKTFFF